VRPVAGPQLSRGSLWDIRSMNNTKTHQEVSSSADIFNVLVRVIRNIGSLSSGGFITYQMAKKPLAPEKCMCGIKYQRTIC